MRRPVAVLLAETDSRELQAWQAFLTWRAQEQAQQRRVAALADGDDDDVTHW